MRKLVQYGMEHYTKRKTFQLPNMENLPVINGVAESVGVEPDINRDTWEKELLLRIDENVDVYIEQEELLYAPIEKGELVGQITYCVNEEVLLKVPIVTKTSVEEKTFFWYVQKVMEKFCII